MRLYRPDAPEDVYVGFPCKTIIELNGYPKGPVPRPE
jgi:hypothetical protein